jgi:hypothetical protein
MVAILRANFLRTLLKLDGVHAVLGFWQYKSPENVANLIVCSSGAAVWVLDASRHHLIRIARRAIAQTAEVASCSVRAALRPWAFGNGKVRHLQPALSPVFVDYTRRRARCSTRRHKQLHAELDKIANDIITTDGCTCEAF